MAAWQAAKAICAAFPHSLYDCIRIKRCLAVGVYDPKQQRNHGSLLFLFRYCLPFLLWVKSPLSGALTISPQQQPFLFFFFFFFWASYERFLVPLTHSSSALGKRKHIIKRQFRVVLASSKTKLSSPLSLSSCAHVHAHSWQFCRDLSSGS